MVQKEDYLLLDKHEKNILKKLQIEFLNLCQV